MIAHQTEKIAGSNCGCLEDGWNNRPKIQTKKGMGWVIESV